MKFPTLEVGAIIQWKENEDNINQIIPQDLVIMKSQPRLIRQEATSFHDIKIILDIKWTPALIGSKIHLLVSPAPAGTTTPQYNWTQSATIHCQSCITLKQEDSEAPNEDP